MISVGHRTGLFDIMAALPPSTSEDIASAAGLSERYVREWLAAMASAKIIEHDARTSTYFLRIEHAALLSTSVGSDSLAPVAQMLSQLASVEDLVVAGFRSGGGASTDAYDRLDEIMAAERRRAVDETWVEVTLELLPGMRRRLLSGAMVLDVGCGDGFAMIEMARLFPNSIFRGYDISAAAIARACEYADEAGLTNVEFGIGDVATLDEQREYDLVIALESIHELGFPRIALRRIVAALKRDGMFLMREMAVSSNVSRNIDHPFAPMLYALSTMHALPMALGQDGEALGRMWGKERASQLLAEAGFRNLHFETMNSDPLHAYCVATLG
jgi:2-polyprenyl-3-methyl-5-hydroxy-6-metoxy-1,4-benzoquinol methylase